MSGQYYPPPPSAAGSSGMLGFAPYLCCADEPLRGGESYGVLPRLSCALSSMRWDGAAFQPSIASSDGNV